MLVDNKCDNLKFDYKVGRGMVYYAGSADFSECLKKKVILDIKKTKPVLNI